MVVYIGQKFCRGRYVLAYLLVDGIFMILDWLGFLMGAMHDAYVKKESSGRFVVVGHQGLWLVLNDTMGLIN